MLDIQFGVSQSRLKMVRLKSVVTFCPTFNQLVTHASSSKLMSEKS